MPNLMLRALYRWALSDLVSFKVTSRPLRSFKDAAPADGRPGREPGGVGEGAVRRMVRSAPGALD